MTIDDPRSEAPGFEDAPCTDPTVDLSRSDHHALAPGADDGGADDPDPGAGAGRSGPNGNGNGNGASGGARSGAGDGPSPDAWSGGDGRPSDAPRRGDRRPGAPWPTDEELDALRLAGDPPADAVAIALLTAYGADAADENEVVARAIRSIMGGPASPDDAVLTWLTDGPTPPDWTDPAKVSAGQELFERWTLPIATCLFCAALPTTLAAPHGAAVLAATSHLGRPRQVAARLAGTGRMLFDALTPTTPCSLEPGGQGHTSILCVRLLHAVVRQALLAGRGPEPWDERHGTPINQEDLLGTLLVFSVTVLDALAKLGIRVQPGEAEAWLHTWSVVGSLMGVDEALLPLTLDRAPALAARVAGRQIGPGPDGPRLAEPLYREMRAAMAPGLRSLPDALTWHLVPEVAGLLDIPRPDRVARRCVRAAGTAATVVQRVPWLRRLAVGPGSRVGRRVLVRLMKEELGDDRPPTLVEASALRAAAARGGWTASRLRRLPGARRRAALDVQALVGTPAIPPLVDAAAIEAIATEGYPFWEPVEDMVIRNRRITTAYAELSRMLARTIAGPGGRWDTNWCTFASWTSATVGRHIATIPPRAARGGRGRRGGSGGPSPLPGAPALDDSLTARLIRLLMRRSDGASYRILAAGNRLVFLNVGTAVVEFLNAFPSRDAATRQDAEVRWDRFWAAVRRREDELALADPSWVITPGPEPRDLYLGFRQYLLALQAEDEHQRSQHVLAGNILIAAYEQRRLDGYVWAALGPRCERDLRRLVHESTGCVGGVRRRLTGLYARAVTRRLRLHLPGEVLRVDRPVPAPTLERDRWPALDDDAGVTLPALQALISRYELEAEGRPRHRSRNWTSYDERMRTVGHLFRLRQRQRSLFDDPLTAAAD